MSEWKLLLKGKAERNEYVKSNTFGYKYFRCRIKGYDLNLGGWNELEEWGYSLQEDLKVAKRQFMKDVDNDLDGPLDYGFMEILEYKIEYDADGHHIGKLMNTYVNDFGKWKTKDKFLKDRFGYEE